MIDCADVIEKLAICDAKAAHVLPKVTFLQPSSKEEPNEFELQGSVTERALMDYVEKYAPINSVVATDAELFESLFLKDRSIPCKVVLIRDRGVVPLWWKGLTAEFKDRLDVRDALM